LDLRGIFAERPGHHHAVAWNTMLVEMACVAKAEDLTAPAFEGDGLKVGDHILCGAKGRYEPGSAGTPGGKRYRMELEEQPPDTIIPKGSRHLGAILRISAPPGCPVGYVVEVPYGLPVGYERRCKAEF
jgi:hypothetical protein